MAKKPKEQKAGADPWADEDKRVDKRAPGRGNRGRGLGQETVSAPNPPPTGIVGSGSPNLATLERGHIGGHSVDQSNMDVGSRAGLGHRFGRQS